jgi:hypothetical protein
MKRTPFVAHPWVVLLVGLDDQTAKECEVAVMPLPVVRVADVANAVERVPTLRPLVVVTNGGSAADELALLRSRPADASAVVVGLEGARGPVLVTKLRAALHEAEASRLAKR